MIKNLIYKYIYITVDGSTRSGERARERAKTTTIYRRRIDNIK